MLGTVGAGGEVDVRDAGRADARRVHGQVAGGGRADRGDVRAPRPTRRRRHPPAPADLHRSSRSSRPASAAHLPEARARCRGCGPASPHGTRLWGRPAARPGNAASPSVTDTAAAAAAIATSATKRPTPSPDSHCSPLPRGRRSAAAPCWPEYRRADRGTLAPGGPLVAVCLSVHDAATGHHGGCAVAPSWHVSRRG